MGQKIRLLKALIDELIFEKWPRYQGYEQYSMLPKGHPQYLTYDQCCRPWTLPTTHPLYRMWLDPNQVPVVTPGAHWMWRFLLRLPLKKLWKFYTLAQDVGAQPLSYWMDERGIVWTCTNKWGSGKEVASAQIQETA